MISLEGLGAILGVFVASIGILGGFVWKAISKVNNDCSDLKDRMTRLEVKQDLSLDKSGYDVDKVNRAIENKMEEIKKNDKPSVGCIHPNELRKERVRRKK